MKVHSRSITTQIVGTNLDEVEYNFDEILNAINEVLTQKTKYDTFMKQVYDIERPDTEVTISTSPRR